MRNDAAKRASGVTTTGVTGGLTASARLGEPPSRALRAGASTAIIALAVVIVLLSGCAAYRMGNEALFPPDIHTVYVPMFTSDSFRRNLGERLSEAVKKEIENRTPYKLVNTPEADSILSGRILRDTKRLTVETATDEPRELEINFVVEVTWVDRRGQMLAQQGVPLPPAVVEFSASAPVRPETGQSITTGQQEVMQRLATQIVDLMEAPW